MPSPGQIVRRLLGPAFQPVGEAYRRIFVDMTKIADWIAARLPPNARVLDVGGGDGYVVQLLLDRRPDIQVTMTDVASDVGSFIDTKHKFRVTLLPETDAAEVEGQFDAITLADVVHHVPAAERDAFFAMLGNVAARSGATCVIVKDIHPKGLRARLSLLSDLYITGDKAVSLIAESEIRLPGMLCVEATMPDFPNYCLRFAPDQVRQ